MAESDDPLDGILAALARSPERAVRAAGTLLGHYRLQRKLGAGGMGEVWAASDEKLQRTVAIKLLPSEVTGDPARRARFEREAKVVAALSHPHIVTLHAIEEHEGQLLLVLELVAGKTLAELLPSMGLPAKELLRLAIPLCDAVGAAHQLGITHRDLKPQNVMVTDDGRLKVLDFGLAKISDEVGVGVESTTATSEGRIVGTIAYMSPEQAQGKRVDLRSDVFSLGVVLFEMATGRRPFEGDSSASLLASILRDDAPSLSELPPSLARVVRRCLEKDPTRRYQSALDVRNDLDELRDSTKAGVAAATAAKRGGRVGWSVAAVALVLGLATGALGPRLLVAPPTEQTVDPVERLTRLTADDGAISDPGLAPDGTWFVYARRAGGHWDLLRQRVGGENPMNLTADASHDDNTEPAIAPDGERIAFRSERQGGGVFLMGATGESVRRVTDLGHSPSWFPDGQALLVSIEAVVNPKDRNAPSSMWVVPLDGKPRRQLRSGDAVQGAVSPSGRRVAYWGLPSGSSQRDVWTSAVEGGDPVAVTRDWAVDWRPIWAPDGRSLIFTSDRGGTMDLWRVPIDQATGQPLGSPASLTRSPGRWAHSASLSRDGKRLAFVAGAAEYRIEKVAFDPVKGVVVGSPIRVTTGIAPCPRGGSLVFVDRTTRHNLVLMQADGSGRRKLTDDDARDNGPRFSPDGQEIAFYSNRGGQMDFWAIRPDGSGLRQLTNDGSHWFPIWSPDGKQMAGYTPERGGFLFDPHRPFDVHQVRQLPPLPDNAASFRPSDWSPDGQSLAGTVTSTNRVDAEVWIYSLASRSYRRVCDRCSDMQAHWLLDSRRLVVVNGPILTIIDTATGTSSPAFSVGQDELDDIHLSEDQKWIFITRIVREASVWMATLR